MADETKLSLKLLVDTKTNVILFAEGSKDFVDFLFQIFSLPIGMAVKLLTTKDMVGSLGDLYKSIEDLSTDYLQPNVVKDSVLNPTCSIKVPLLMLNDEPPVSSPAKKFYRCSSHYSYVADGPDAVCPSCRRTMSYEIIYVAAPKASASSSDDGGGGPFVKGVVTYMIMDNLEIKPISAISCIALINKLHVQDPSSLAETDVQVGLKEGLAILKASLETRAVLTTVFSGAKEDKSEFIDC